MVKGLYKRPFTMFTRQNIAIFPDDTTSTIQKIAHNINIVQPNTVALPS